MEVLHVPPRHVAIIVLSNQEGRNVAEISDQPARLIFEVK
jgi:hypothetical protein